MKCKYCGDAIKLNNMQGYCQSCYRYFVMEGKEVYPTPPYGQMDFAPNGDCVCPECGMAFRKLGAHLWNKHHILAKEAYIKFGWDISCRASNEQYQQHMRDVLQPKCVVENLIKDGEKTRFVTGGPGRPASKMSEMTRQRLKLLKKNKEENV